MRIGLIGAGAGIALLLLSACQPEDERPAVSLAEAKKVTTELKGQARFVPPPRSISDISALLDRYKPDPERARALARVADAAPPAGADAANLTRFYLRRSGAARNLGRMAQTLADARTALRHGTEVGFPRVRLLNRIVVAEMQAGNFRTALKVAEKLKRDAETRPGIPPRVNAYAILGEIKFQMGDIAAGASDLREAERLINNPRFARARNYDVLSRNSAVALNRTFARMASATGKYDEAERIIRRNIVDVQWLQANQARARAILRTTPRYFEAVEGTLRRNLAIALLRQNRVVEAEVEARRALQGTLEINGRDSIRTVISLSLLGNILAEQGRPEEALTLAAAGLDICNRMGAGKGSRRVANLLRLRARAFNALRNFEGALEAWQQALATLTNNEDRERFQLHPNYASVLLRAGRFKEALAIWEEIYKWRRERLGDEHFNTAVARGFLAAALARTGQTSRALREFQAAIPILLQASRRSDDEEEGGKDTRRRLRSIYESYVRLLSRLNPGNRAGLDPADEAFRIADAARAGGVQQALAASAARGAVHDPALAQLARQEQDAQKQIGALFGLLSNILSGPAEEQNPAAVAKLRADIDRLRTARAALREEIERRFPDYVALIDPRPATIADVRKVLRPGEALLSIYVTGAETYVWAVPASGESAFAHTPLGRRQAKQYVRLLRRALDPNAATLGDIPAYDVVLAYRLYSELLQPVAAAIDKANSLLVVPHGPLAQLPFGLLVTEKSAPAADGSGALFSGYRRIPFLIRRTAVTQLPSVAALATLRAQPPGSAARRAFAGFGDPWFNTAQQKEAEKQQLAALVTRGLRTRSVPLRRRSAPATATAVSAEIGLLPRLPDTATEVRSIARVLHADPATDVFLGASASEQTVKTVNLVDRKVILFATHGLVPGDLNGLSEPALALSAPAVTGAGGDGLLTMGEILGLRLNADWVVLSACNTAAGDGAGVEAVSGLGRAFFYAGTRAVLVSNWPVETSSARALTTDLFRRQAENPALPRAEAMRQAMLALIDGPGFIADGKTVFSYAHPIFWAPFSVVGDGGGDAGNS